MSNDFQYSGRDNLDIMALAENYNHSIYKWLSNGINKDEFILDYGSGHGEFFKRFNSFCTNTFAIEPDTSMHTYYPSGSVYKSIKQIDHKFDFIYSVNVLEHIFDDESVVREFQDHLSNEYATIKVFVPARQELFSVMDKKVGHHRRYSKHQLERLFSENGYVVKSCRYFDFLGYFAALAYKFLNKQGDIDKHGLIVYDKYIFPLSLFFDKIFSRFLGKNLMLEASLKQPEIKK